MSYKDTALYRSAFGSRRGDRHSEARKFFRDAFERLRENVAPLVAQIARDLPQLTIHDVSHLDALWETACTIAGPNYALNPAEAFVFGGGILLHDAGMCAAAYKNGLDEIRATKEWRDCAVLLLRRSGVLDPTSDDLANLSATIADQVLFLVLRERHAEQAESLPLQEWPDHAGSKAARGLFLIENAALRSHYGPHIGRIAHSHHTDVFKLPSYLQRTIPAIALPLLNVPSEWFVDSLKLASLLRVADASHIDARRAPRQQRVFVNPKGVSRQHWKFQQKLGQVRRDGTFLCIASGDPFSLADADAWWLAFDTAQMIDRELREVDDVLRVEGVARFACNRVRGAESPGAFAQDVRTDGSWRPIDARLRVSDVASVVRALGGEKLYESEPSFAIRELIQNAADAIRARRKLYQLPVDYGRIVVRRRWSDDESWIEVEDDGIGMAENVLSGVLLDFGRSLWSSDELRSEWPGLAGSGFRPVGRFGIGFYSVFMLGEEVRVVSRRCDKGVESARTLEFRQGLSTRPIMRTADVGTYPQSGGTIVSVRLKPGVLSNDLKITDPEERERSSLAERVAWLAPMLDVTVDVEEDGVVRETVRANDWLHVSADRLLKRLQSPDAKKFYPRRRYADFSALQTIEDANGVYGRAALLSSTVLDGSLVPSLVVCVGGLRAGPIEHRATGVIVGETDQLSRLKATPTVPSAAWSNWATGQAKAIADQKWSREDQLKAAAAIMRLGGHPSNLPICHHFGSHSKLATDALFAQVKDKSAIGLLVSDRRDVPSHLMSAEPEDLGREVRSLPVYGLSYESEVENLSDETLVAEEEPFSHIRHRRKRKRWLEERERIAKASEGSLPYVDVFWVPDRAGSALLEAVASTGGIWERRVGARSLLGHLLTTLESSWQRPIAVSDEVVLAHDQQGLVKTRCFVLRPSAIIEQ